MDAPFPEAMLGDIQKFFKEVHPGLSPGEDLYQEVFQTQLFFPLQRQAELSSMMWIARQFNPQVVCEIGADKGGGLYHWCQCFPSVRKIIGVEIRGTPYARDFEEAFPHIEFCWYGGHSRAPALHSHLWRWLNRRGRNLPDIADGQPGYKEREEEFIDVLFIDGDKLTMVEDFDSFRPLMNPKGVVFIHDVQDREPREAFEKLINRGYAWQRIVLTHDAEHAMAREKQGIPPATPHEGWLRHWKGRSCGVGVIYLDPARTGRPQHVVPTLKGDYEGR